MPREGCCEHINWFQRLCSSSDLWSLICDITPLCALVLAATVAIRFQRFMKAYLQRHLINRVYFRVVTVRYPVRMARRGLTSVG
jgi:hypothetical protein